jgi:hypothetical protein
MTATAQSVGEGVDPVMALIGMGGGFQFEAPGNVRDVRWLGDVQKGTIFLSVPVLVLEQPSLNNFETGTHELVKLLGWEDDFQKLLATAQPASPL